MFLKKWIIVLLTYCYSIYIDIYRTIIKPIVYFITKTHEIDRIILSKTNDDYSKYLLLSIYPQNFNLFIK